MNKRYAYLFLLLSLIVISLSCVHAENNSVDSDVDTIVSDDINIDNSDVSYYTEAKSISKVGSDVSKESYNHNITTSDDLYDVLDSANDLTGTHTIELCAEEVSIDDRFYVNNNDLELIFNGNGNQLNFNDDIFFIVKKVTFNNMIIETNATIRNNADEMFLNNVTVKNTEEYNDLVNLFKEKGYYDFNDFDDVTDTFSKINIATSIENDKVLYVNNCHFINNAAISGSAIYNDGKLYVDNSVFEDSIGKFGIIFSNNDSVITNCEFNNNRVMQQLILSQGNSELYNNTFTNNRVAGSSIVDNRGEISIKDSLFTDNIISYELIDNWNYMDLSNVSFYNNTCKDLVNSFGNLTLNDSIIKDNTCYNRLICRNTLYDESGKIYATGNVTLTNNMIYPGDVNRYDFYNNYNHGNLSLYNNTIIDKPNYIGNCIFVENTFVPDENLIDAYGNIQGYPKDFYIEGNLNYEVVDKIIGGITITMEGIKNITLGESVEVTGTVNYYDNTPLINETVTLSYAEDSVDPEQVYEIKNLTDETGRYSFTFKPEKSGKYNITVFYGSYYYRSCLSVLEKNNSLIETILSVTPLNDHITIDENILLIGILTDINGNPLGEKNIFANIQEGSSDDGIYGYSYDITTDENGRYVFNHTPTHLEELYVSVYFHNDTIYLSSQANTSAWVDRIKTYTSLNPVPSEMNIGESVLITGYLTDVNNNTLSHQAITVQVNYANDTVGYSVETDEKGEYAYNFIPDKCGTYGIDIYPTDDKFSPMNSVKISVDVINNTENDNNKNESDEQIIIDNSNETFDKNTSNTTHINSVKDKRINVKYNIIILKNNKLVNQNILKVNTEVKLSWLNNLFNEDFANKHLLIYINGILVFNGTVSNNSSKVLFKVLEDYKGEQVLKVVADDKTYQREIIVQ